MVADVTETRYVIPSLDSILGQKNLKIQFIELIFYPGQRNVPIVQPTMDLQTNSDEVGLRQIFHVKLILHHSHSPSSIQISIQRILTVVVHLHYVAQTSGVLLLRNRR